MKNKKTKKTDDTVIDMPEVKDIPGQEKIRPPRMSEMEDTTISSAGEEGDGILDDLNQPAAENEVLTDDESNVSDTERELLEQSERPVTDETKDLQKLALDNTDEEDPLNEQGNPLDMGQDLDVPGAELDDDNEEIGEEDEENNAYSGDSKQ
jgi:hypothetical protein